MAWKAGILAGALLLGWPSAAAARDRAAPALPDVEPRAMRALARSADYLRGLGSFALGAELRIETTPDDSLSIEEHYRLRYEYRAPDGLFVDWQSQGESRQLYFDGRTLTLYLPATGYYVDLEEQRPAAEMLIAAAYEFGIVLPLPDPFLWAVSDAPPYAVERAIHVGRARIEGADTDHYVFRQEEIDWQIWIERGRRPLPRRIVIAARNDPDRPVFSATLRWTLRPRLAGGRFTFRPPAGARPIEDARRGARSIAGAREESAPRSGWPRMAVAPPRAQDRASSSHGTRARARAGGGAAGNGNDARSCRAGIGSWSAAGAVRDEPLRRWPPGAIPPLPPGGPSATRQSGTLPALSRRCLGHDWRAIR